MTTVNEVATEMKNRAAQFGGLGGTVKFDFGSDGSIFVDGTKTPADITTGGGEADCRLEISLENFIKMNSGQLAPIMAFSTGKLKVHGNMGLAMKLSSLMDD